MISQMAEMLRDPSRLIQQQREDARLGPIGGRLQGDGHRHTPEGTSDYVLDDNDLIWNTPLREEPKLDIPRALVPGELAPVQCTCGHQGVAQTLMMVRGKYQWPTVAQDVRDYVLWVQTKEASMEPTSGNDARPTALAVRGTRDVPAGHEAHL